MNHSIKGTERKLYISEIENWVSYDLFCGVTGWEESEDQNLDVKSLEYHWRPASRLCLAGWMLREIVHAKLDPENSKSIWIENWWWYDKEIHGLSSKHKLTVEWPMSSCIMPVLNCSEISKGF